MILITPRLFYQYLLGRSRKQLDLSGDAQRFGIFVQLTKLRVPAWWI